MKSTFFCLMALLVLLIPNRISAQSADTIPAAVTDFYKVTVEPNPRAPVETTQFGQLEGIWYCQGYEPDESGGLKPSGTAYWAWKYILDGYGVQDLWYQGENESLYYTYFKRELMLTQIRVYDVNAKQWKVAFINNHAGEVPGRMYGTFSAYAEGKDVIMDFEPRDPELLKRIIFYDIQEKSFQWKVEVSADQGKTWKLTSYINATRLK